METMAQVAKAALKSQNQMEALHEQLHVKTKKLESKKQDLQMLHACADDSRMQLAQALKFQHRYQAVILAA